ncbi:g6394 [Coccomyxa elongata]
MRMLTMDLDVDQSRNKVVVESLHDADERQLQSKLRDLVKHIRENKLRITFTDALGQAAQSEGDGVSSQKEARRLAFYLFWNVRASHDREFVVLEDLCCFLPTDKAKAALSVLDVDGDGKISLDDMRDAVISIYKERKHLALTLRVDIAKVWATITTVLLAFVFVFGNSIRNIYEAVIFLFVVHPFDVGDVLLMGADAAWHQVEEVALQNVVLRRSDGLRISFPITKLLAEPVFNVSRSNNRWEGFKVLVDISTPAATFDHVDAAVAAHTVANPNDFTGKHLVVANNAGDPLKYMLCVWWEYCHPGTELRRMSMGRHGLYLAITKALIEAGVRYTLPPYDNMSAAMLNPMRPHGEGQIYLPPFLQKGALKL